MSDAGSSRPLVDDPDWVRRNRERDADARHFLYAVGARSGIQNPALLQSAADNAARSEMQKAFAAYVALLKKVYSAGTAPSPLETQLVGAVLNTFAAGTLSNVELVDHWRHPVDGTMYALARLDTRDFLAKVDREPQLSEKMKERIRRASERAGAEWSRVGDTVRAATSGGS